MVRYRWVCAMACVAGVSATGNLQAASNIGTLTCTIAQVPEDPKVDIQLSCNFAAHDGWQRDYVGTATRNKSARFPSGKHVLVWSVVAGKRAERPVLEGTYQGRTGGTGAGVLVGGPSGATRLESASGSAQLAGPRALTKLSLKAVQKRA